MRQPANQVIDHIDAQQYDHQEQIAILTFRHKKDCMLAMQFYARVNQTATYSAITVFLVMSFFLHGILLEDSTSNTAHILAFVVNAALASITYVLIHEFHPSKLAGAHYMHFCKQRQKQLENLKQKVARYDSSVSSHSVDNQRF